MAKSFLLIGGSSDIAQILARELLDSGHLVTLLARDVGRISHLKDMGADIIEGDALDEAVVSSAVEHAKGRSEDGLSGAAHLVGSIALRPPHATKLEDFEAVIQTNLVSAFLMLKLVGKAMLRNGTGRMVFTSSVAGSYGLTNHEAISAAKSGVECLVRGAAATYAANSIRVNAVAPGIMDTPAAAKILSSDLLRVVAARQYPLASIGSADELANLIVWLLSEEAARVTGQVWSLDGGFSTIRPYVK